MRTYGRVGNTWEEVTTDSNGFNDQVYITTLIQVLKLNLGESPFYANYGIPARQSVVQQIFPDYYVSYVQQQFSPYFASLTISRVSESPPTYQVNLITHTGVKLNTNVAVPQ